jgi:hypothetical protein
MKNYEKEETTNLVHMIQKMIAHNSHGRRSKNAPKRWKIQNLEKNRKKTNGKMKFWPILIFDRFFLIFSPYYKVMFWVFNHFFEKLLMPFSQNSLFL